jgi:hypothetical protein
MWPRRDSWELDEGPDFQPESSVVEMPESSPQQDESSPQQDGGAEQSTPMPSLDATWSVMDREPGMDDIIEKAGDSLEKMGEDLEIFPFQDTDDTDRLFLARFEFPKFGEEFEFPEGTEIDGAEVPGAIGFIDFLAGFPLDNVEILVYIGEFSSKTKEGEDKKVAVQEGDSVTPPVWDGDSEIFEWPEDDKILLNLTALIPEMVQAEWMAPNIAEPEPEKAHWWFRIVWTEGEQQFPVPGEFGGLGVRMMPGEYCGKQKSSPFVYSGNWMDTVYYTSAVIKEIIEPTDETPYPIYKAQWRKNKITVNPSDFAEYKVDDRVTILKDVATEKKSQLWKDDDMDPDCDKETWQIVPITFYGLDTQAGG